MCWAGVLQDRFGNTDLHKNSYSMAGIGNFGPAEFSSNPDQTHMPVTF